MIGIPEGLRLEAREALERIILRKILRKHVVRSRSAPGVSKRRMRRWGYPVARRVR